MHAAIIGVIASRSAYVEYEYEYFTSVQYPILVEESLAVGLPSPSRGVVWGYQDEQLSVGLPTPVSANLQPVIVYQTYNNGQPEDLSVALPTPVSGNLQPVIAYVNYNNSAAVDDLSVNLPQVISGSLS